jgi:hypothetical protein
MATDAAHELDRLAGVLSHALKMDAPAHRHLIPCSGDSVYAVAGGPDRHVETALHTSPDEAVAELRAILRADTDGAVADVLDELASLASEGTITAEMLRAMAAARRAR